MKHQGKPNWTALLICTFCFGSVLPLWSRTMYISATGDDSAPCANGSRFRTLSRAVACLAPADTLLIQNGTFTGGVKISVQATADNPIVIQGESLEAIISGSGSQQDAIRIDNASHITVQGITVRQASRGGIAVLNSHHVKVLNCRLADNDRWGIFTGFADDIHFEGNECYGSKNEHGIYHSNSGDRFIIRSNICHDNAACGIHINGDPDMGGDGVISYGIVEKNIVYSNGRAKGGAGINMTHVQDVIVRNNLLYRNFAGGFTFYQDSGTFAQGSKRALFMGNTVFFKPDSGRTDINVQTTSEKAVIIGNIFVSGGIESNYLMETDHVESVFCDHNILWGVDSLRAVERKEQGLSIAEWRNLTGNDRHSLMVNPCFARPDSGDFQPADSSRAVDAGMTIDSVKVILERLGGFEWTISQLDSLPQEDITGKKRPLGKAPDAGAYETGADPIQSYDYNGDKKLNILDVISLLVRGKKNPHDQALDINGDGIYTIFDLIALLGIIKGVKTA